MPSIYKNLTRYANSGVTTYSLSISGNSITLTGSDGSTSTVTVPTATVDIFYPVGSYYETSDTNFDPNVVWAGTTWELETSGQVHVSAGAGYVVSGATTNTSDGGSIYIQQHKHYYNPPVIQPSGYLAQGITGGGHAHQYGYLTQNRGSGSTATRVGPYGHNSPNVTDIGSSTDSHTHNLPNHVHTYEFPGSVEVVSDVGAANSGNMQPYIVVNRWHRTA